MAEVKWIKIVTDVFDNRKIKQIEKLPEADTIIVIWFKLLCLAGNINESGLLMLTKDIPYTDEMLASEFRRELNTVRYALNTFEKFGMIEIADNVLCVSNWQKYQNIETLDTIREKTRKRVATYRDKQKQLAQCNVTVTLQETLRNATERDKERDKDKELDIEGEYNEPKALPTPYEEIKDYFNSVCISYPKIISLSDKRKTTLKGLIKSYSLEKVKEVFNKAEKSDFLKGKNDRQWKATFDWIINPTNFLKILEGNFDNKSKELNYSHPTDFLGG